MKKYSKKEIIEMLKEQRGLCSDKVYNLLTTDDDAETWHEKVLDTELVDIDEY